MVAIAEQIDRSALSNLCQKFGVRRLWLFGSVARGDTRDDSDIDVLVEYQPGQRVGFFELGDLSDALKPLFGGNREVDLVIEKSLHPLIRKHVQRDWLVLYEG